MSPPPTTPLTRCSHSPDLTLSVLLWRNVTWISLFCPCIRPMYCRLYSDSRLGDVTFRSLHAERVSGGNAPSSSTISRRARRPPSGPLPAITTPSKPRPATQSPAQLGTAINSRATATTPTTHLPLSL